MAILFMDSRSVATRPTDSSRQLVFGPGEIVKATSYSTTIRLLITSIQTASAPSVEMTMPLGLLDIPAVK